MIVFDLACGKAGHIFEVWFGSSADFEDQKKRGLVTCPYCGSTAVDKAVMAPNVAPKGNKAAPPVSEVPVAANLPSPSEFKEMIGKLAELQAKMLEKSDFVGTHFADEARAMHVGDIEARPIHGQTTADEAKALIEEGVPVAPLLLPVRPPKTDN